MYFYDVDGELYLSEVGKRRFGKDYLKKLRKKK